MWTDEFFQEVVLMEQTWVHDSESTVAKVLGEAAEAVGAPIALAGFVRFALGEGVEKEETDTAA